MTVLTGRTIKNQLLKAESEGNVAHSHITFFMQYWLGN